MCSASRASQRCEVCLTAPLPSWPRVQRQGSVVKTAGAFSWACEGGRNRHKDQEGERGSLEKGNLGACAVPSSTCLTPQLCATLSTLPRNSFPSPTQLPAWQKELGRPVPVPVIGHFRNMATACFSSTSPSGSHHCHPLTLLLGSLRVPLTSF